jgi:hypothetical protein
VSAASFSKYFLYSAQVVAAMVRSVAAGEGGLQQVGGVALPAAPPAPISVCASSMNRMIGFGRGLHFVDDAAQAVLELALHAGAGLQQTEIERAQRHTRSAGGTSPDAERPQSLRPPRSCRRRPHRSGSDCSAAGASAYR